MGAQATTQPERAEILISADSHVVEPDGLWQDSLPERLKDQAPRVERRDGKISIYSEAKLTLAMPEQVLLDRGVEMTEQGTRQVRPHFGWAGQEPDERVRVLEQDGITAEILYPNLGLQTFSMVDAELRRRSARLYNDWVAAEYGSDPHFYPGALIPTQDIAVALQEAERAIAKGFRTLLLPLSPGAVAYSDPIYEPIWSLAAANGVPISLHCATSTKAVASSSEVVKQMGAFDFSDPSKLPAGMGYSAVLGVYMEALLAVAWIAGGGVLERFPELHVVMVECGAGWLAWLMEMLDGRYTEKPEMLYPTLAMPPSFYVKRQVHCTIINDRTSVLNRDATGVDALMWSSDYPHFESVWPHTHRQLERLFDGVTPEDRAAITSGNAARLYGLPL